MERKSKTLTFSTATSNILTLFEDANYQIPSGIIIPNDAAFNGKTLEVQVSDGGSGAYYPLYDMDGAKFTITLGANRAIYFDMGNFVGWKFLKFVASGSLDGKTMIVAYSGL